MKTVGVVAEYNPFHNGHQYHLQAARKAAEADAVFVVMSGPVTQRGTFAVMDKWQRAGLALRGGADLVCELPFVYAGQTAEVFAAGAVGLLAASGVCDALAFGAECGDIRLLSETARYLAQEPPAFQAALHSTQEQGLSFPAARAAALKATLGDDAAALLTSPNNTLAVEYLKALYRLGDPLTPLAIARLGPGHHDLNASDRFASASALRSCLFKGEAEQTAAWLPYDPRCFEEEALSRQQAQFERLVLAELLTADAESLRSYPDVTEGLEFALLNALKAYSGYEDLVAAAASRRIPQSRIRRILMNLCLHYKADDFTKYSKGPPPYLRVLAFNARGRKLLRRISDDGSVPVITNLRSNQTRLSPHARQVLERDVRASNLFFATRGEDARLFDDYRVRPIEKENEND